MKSAASIVYRDLESSPALNDTIQKKLDKLFRLSERLSVQRVVINAPHQHHHKGSQFEVSVEMTQGGKPLNISHSDDSVHLAVKSVFSSAERAVKEQGAKWRSKRHIDKHASAPATPEEDEHQVFEQAS
ncbi:HPF/RaiA family ribosome-associated protein [Simiduia curdlanivorans]|uniref:HPF/RaiA family ribosome-associated protein n=1 Tax=Simiduia curdlanivorans TaxID=1492769 RepID=A0ABV8V8K6_9GAMM|nr:HPF/RaiA family ribosome-associated protein [Simiduia curdlanivorans]MDN3639436.1 HPF/RaiA family ribosome-associated protein [Simiduia curdlanivorans]